ncbi:hypothetical protein AGLY_011800 [Aphis glycines]|uniref:Uncharacterized protein n=1 Tax=Aphis glycines TaxID=307491 RepID=A0A6G0TDD4_APHGL|nr:hypothetical protein AGLY_011800 [Aphis glycines]
MTYSIARLTSSNTVTYIDKTCSWRPSLPNTIARLGKCSTSATSSVNIFLINDNDGVSTHLINCCSATLPIVLMTIKWESLTTPNIVSDILSVQHASSYTTSNAVKETKKEFTNIDELSREISRSLTPPTGGGSTCTKVVLGGATSSPRPAVAHPRHGTSRQYLTARGSVPPSRPNRPALVVSSIIIYHLSSGVPICLRDIVGIGQSREKFNSI